MSPDWASKEKFPSKSVIVPLLVPFTMTFAPITGSGSPSAITTPVTVMLCAYVLIDSTAAQNSANSRGGGQMFHLRIHCSSQIRLMYIAYEVFAFDFGRFCTHTLRNPLQRYRNTTKYANSENMLFNILFQRLFVWKILHKIHNSLRIIINHFSKLFHTKMYYKKGICEFM